MSRTDELRRGGAKERGSSGGGAPFVKWPESYAWVEGRVTEHFQTKYGAAVTLDVEAVSDGLQAKGKSEEGELYTRTVVAGSDVNVGLSAATLKDMIGEGDKGKSFHIAFEGWGETKNGDRFRQFTVLDITREHERSDEGIEPWPDDEDIPAEVPGSDDGLPF